MSDDETAGEMTEAVVEAQNMGAAEGYEESVEGLREVFGMSLWKAVAIDMLMIVAGFAVGEVIGGVVGLVCFGLLFLFGFIGLVEKGARRVI